MIRTTPLRRITLHLSQIFFTLGRTFMMASHSLGQRNLGRLSEASYPARSERENALAVGSCTRGWLELSDDLSSSRVSTRHPNSHSIADN